MASSGDMEYRRASAAAAVHHHPKRKRSFSTMVKSVMKSDRKDELRGQMGSVAPAGHRRDSIRGLREKFKGLFHNSQQEDDGAVDSGGEDWPKSQLRLSRSMPNILDIDDLKNVNSFEELEALEIYKEQKRQALREVQLQHDEAKEQKQALEQKSSWPAQKSRSLLSDIYFDEVKQHDRKRSTSLLLRKLSSNSFTGIEEEAEEDLEEYQENDGNNNTSTGADTAKRLSDGSHDDEQSSESDIRPHFTDEQIRTILSEELHSKLDDQVFQPEVMNTRCREISENIQLRIKEMTQSTKKVIVKVFAAAFLDKGVHVAVKCLHDEQTDNYVTVSLLGCDWHAWASALVVDVC